MGRDYCIQVNAALTGGPGWGGGHYFLCYVATYLWHSLFFARIQVKHLLALCLLVSSVGNLSKQFGPMCTALLGERHAPCQTAE